MPPLWTTQWETVAIEVSIGRVIQMVVVQSHIIIHVKVIITVCVTHGEWQDRDSLVCGILSKLFPVVAVMNPFCNEKFRSCK